MVGIKVSRYECWENTNTQSITDIRRNLQKLCLKKKTHTHNNWLCVMRETEGEKGEINEERERVFFFSSLVKE